MDLVSASVAKLESLPNSDAPSEEPSSGDQEKLKEWLEDMTERAERIGGEEAQFSLGQYFFKLGVYQEALGYFERAAKGESPNSGWSQAKYQLGVMYYDGLGVKVDMKRGFEYMMEVAQSVRKKDSNLIPSAQYNVGRAYFMGFGVTQSDSEAEKWWSLAGDHGDDPSSTRAQNTLGMFFSRQETFDLNKAFHWTLLAAEGGHLESMAALGLLYLRGQNGNHGDEEGLKWLKRSSDGGCVYGTGLLSHLYFTRKLFSKAAESAFRVSEIEDSSEETTPLSSLDRRGIAIGCFVLGRCLQLGQAVGRNDEKALHYYTKASNLDKPVVAELHDLLTHGKV